MILRMTWEPSQRNSAIAGGNEKPLKESSRPWHRFWGLRSSARMVGQNRDKSEGIPAVVIPKDLAMTARGRFQQDAGVMVAAEKDK